MKQFTILGLLLTATPALSETIFERLEGRSIGTVEYAELACGTNPSSISFSNNLDRATFTTMHPIEDDLGETRSVWTYTVVGSSESYVTLLLDDEARVDEENHPLAWKFHLAANDLMCWQRDDRPAGACGPIYETCTGS